MSSEEKIAALEAKIAELEAKLSTLSSDYAQGLVAVARGNQLLANHAHELDITVAALRWSLVHEGVLNDESLERKRMDIRLAFGANEEAEDPAEEPAGFTFGGSAK